MLAGGIFKGVEMRKIILLIAAVAFLMVPGKALSQQIETWQGIEWECAMANGIDLYMTSQIIAHNRRKVSLGLRQESN